MHIGSYCPRNNGATPGTRLTGHECAHGFGTEKETHHRSNIPTTWRPSTGHAADKPPEADAWTPFPRWVGRAWVGATPPWARVAASTPAAHPRPTHPPRTPLCPSPRPYARALSHAHNINAAPIRPPPPLPPYPPSLKLIHFIQHIRVSSS
jgi:hypothetical protein